ncbi:MAG: FtsW/RodA/SpoVE family cell cycle protein [Oscillospiraceae bacterium]
MIEKFNQLGDSKHTFWDYLKRLDKSLLIGVSICAMISILSLYSIYISQVIEITENQWFIQTISALIGIISCFIITAIDYHKLANLWFLYVPISLILVGLTFTSLGYGRGDADDIAWIQVGSISIQPAELLKVAFLLSFSLHLSKVGDNINNFGHFLLLCLHGCIPVGLVILQGDYGTAIIFGLMFAIMMVFAGLSIKYILPILTSIPIALYLVWTYLLSSVHKDRISVLLNPGSDPLGIEYQQNLGKSAMAQGGLIGKGLFKDDYIFVPEMHNDFIFAFVGQSLGFVGCMIILLIFAFICIKILMNGKSAKDSLGRNICVGTFAMIFTHCFMNIGMVLGVMPVIGIPLPFMSAGGTAMLSMFIAIGLVLSTHSHREKQKRMFYDINEF